MIDDQLEHTTPITFPEDETFDVGQDTRTGIALLEYRDCRQRYEPRRSSRLPMRKPDDVPTDGSAGSSQ